MVWFTFTDDFDFRATPRSLVSYKAGQTKNVTRNCRDAALAKGAGQEADPKTTEVFLTNAGLTEDEVEASAEALAAHGDQGSDAESS